jgi:hypothetical protein
VDETFRMLGREHEADLEREAPKRRLAAEVAEGRRDDPTPRRRGRRKQRLRIALARIAALCGLSSQ